MAEAIVETLLDKIPNDEIRAIYLKGSAKKRWDTPIDYVPEASDLDIHLWFYDDDGERAHIGRLDQALTLQQDMETQYRAKCPRPIHTPRPQIIVMNDMLRRPGYMHSPPTTVKVLYGESCPAADYSAANEIMRYKCHDLLAFAEVIDRLPMRVVDRPGRYLAEVLRDLGYRVSPAGPILLHLAGIDPMVAWSMNRTQVAQGLVDIGHHTLANTYVRYYLARWRWFLSAFNDFDSLRDAVRAASEVIERAESVARSCLSQLET